MSLLSSTIGDVRCLADEEADHNMLQDLQLAAELGKNLLERNKELEHIVKIHQSTVEEQAQEIEYMKKQTAALREVNDSRLKIYEQLEVSIQDLERANHRLVVENTGDKKLIKSQCLTIENLEARCDELQKRIDELMSERDALLRRQASRQSSDVAQELPTNRRASGMQCGGLPESAAPDSSMPFREATVDANVRQLATALANDEEVTELLRQLQEARSQRAREQEKVTELGQQLTSLLVENTALEEQLNVWRSKAQDVKNLQEEISTLEEVRRGQLCGRCLRVLDGRAADDISVLLDHEEFDDISVAESLVNDNRRDSDSVAQDTIDGRSRIEDMDAYKELEEKYQALIKVQKNSVPKRKNSVPTACVSLQEELEMSGEFNSFQGPAISENNTGKMTRTGPCRPSSGNIENGTKKPFSATPTDFSEAETSSSGFLEETSNKSTQTDGRPGSFLCSIADGEDCKFSIYDDNSPFESRFRKTPEYRQLFGEIFQVLKRAAEAKDENERLLVLDESTSTNANSNTTTTSGNVSQCCISDTSATQDDAPSETTDDNISVMSSVVSSVVSEPLFRVHTPIPSGKSPDTKEEKRNGAESANGSTKSAQILGTRNNGARLEYLSVNVNIRKKSSSRKNSASRKSNDRPVTSDVVPTTNPKFVPPKSSSRRRFRPFTAQDECTWNGHTQYIYSNRTKESQQNERRRESNGSYTRGTSSDQSNSSFEYGDYKPSTASEEVARLRRLEMSYAEALRTPNKSKVNNRKNFNTFM